MKFLRITWNGMPIYINVNSIGCGIGCEGGARICLAEAVDRLEAAGLPVVFHIHDEVVIDAAPQLGTLDDVIRIMAEPPWWAPDLPLNADGWENPFFKKD